MQPMLTRFYHSTKTGKLEASVIINDGQIGNLDSIRKEKFRREYNIEKLLFPQGSSLTNSTIGDIGFRENFFIEVEGQFNVKTEGTYEFRVASDDGFRLLIDFNKVSEFNSDRQYSITKGDYYLTPGRHSFRLEYFQRSGPLGLEATYKLQGTEKAYYLGQNSEQITFEDMAK